MANDKKGVATAIGAAAVGAAIGAAAVALSDKKNREMLQKTALDLKEKGKEKLKEFEKKAVELKEEGRQKLVEGLDKAKEMVCGSCSDDDCSCDCKGCK